MSKAVIHKRDYIAHLKSLPPETIIGRRKSACCCPLAREVERVHPDYRDVSVWFGIAWQDDVRHHAVDAPGWVRQGVHCVDKEIFRAVSANMIGGDANTNVTAAEMLAIFHVRTEIPA